MSATEAAAPAKAVEPKLYRWLQAGLRLLIRLFFREVEITGLEHVPQDRGGVVVSWHPNGLIDPGLILTHFPRRVIFGARHGLFKWPILGFVLRQVGTVPIYRAADAAKSDPEARRRANEKSLDALASEVAGGSFAALFPEGISHDEPYLKEIKTGVARLYYRARSLQPAGSLPPVIIPAGLHYDRKRLFRSRALVWFHPAIELPPELDLTPPPDEDEEHSKARVRDLTARIEHILRNVIHATDDWSIHFLLHRTRKLVRAERAQRAGADPGKPRIGEKALGFARIRTGYYTRLAENPVVVETLRKRVETYDANMRALRIDDHELDRDPRLASPWLAALLLLQAMLVFLLLPPVLVFGYLANAPTALALLLITRIAARKKKDEATIKLLVGSLAFPITWLLAAVLGAIGHRQLHATYPALPDRPILTGASIALMAALGGAAGLRYLHVAQETARSIRVRLTRRRRRAAIGELRVERAELCDAVLEMAEGLELPGVVAADGSIRPS